MSWVYFLSILVFAWVCRKDLKQGLALFCALTPVYLLRLSIGGLPTTLLEILFWVLFLFWIFSSKYSKSGCKYSKSGWRKFSFFNFFLGLFFTGSLVGVIISPDKLSALGLWRAYFLEPLVFYFILISVLKHSKDWKPVWIYLGVSLLLAHAYGLIQFVYGVMPFPWNDPLDYRVTSFFPYPNAYALWMLPLLVIYFGFWFGGYPLINYRVWDFAFKFIVIFSGVWSLVVIRSVGAGIAFFLVCLLFISRFVKKQVYQEITIGVICFLALGSLLFLTRSPEILKDSRDLILLEDNSGQIRLALWTGALRMLGDFIFWGAGIGGFEFYYEQYKMARHTETLLYPHFWIFNFWLEIGFMGFVGLVGMLYCCFRDAVHRLVCGGLTKEKGVEIISLSAALAIIFIYGLVDVPYFKNDLAIIFYSILAAARVV